MKFVKNNILLVLGLILLICLVVFIGLIPPQLLKIIIDNYLLKKDSNGLLNMGLIYLGVIIFIGVFDLLKNILLTILGQKISKEIRIKMIYKLEKLNTNYFTTNDSGTIVSRFTNDIDAINTLFSNGIISMLIDCFKIIGIVISIWIFNKTLAFIAMVLIPIIFIITKSFKKKMLNAQIKNRKLIGKVNNHISETMKNLTMIKTYGKEKYMEDKYKEYLYQNYETVEKVNYLDSIYSPIIMILRATCICIIVLLACKDINILNMSVGMVAASIELMSNLFAPIESLGMELQSIQSSISGIYRIKEFFNATEDSAKDPTCTYDNIIKNNLQIQIAFNNLSFDYTENVPVLKNISLTINALDKITFMGRTGVGKSTLFKLTLGILKPSSGSITINGIDTYKIPNREKRKIFGYVEQSFSFIKGTIRDQISLKDSSISNESIIAAMSFVGLHKYVCNLKYGYKTVVADESLFSQGQKQLLAIARAIVTNPPILLLDEITANLDSDTEKNILSVLQRASSSRTILSISHRISSIMANNKIINLSDKQ